MTSPYYDKARAEAADLYWLDLSKPNEPFLRTWSHGFEWEMWRHTRTRWTCECRELRITFRGASQTEVLTALQRRLLTWDGKQAPASAPPPTTPPITPSGPVICDDADEAAIEVLPLRWQRVQVRICDANGRQMSVSVDWRDAVELGERMVELAKVASTGAPRPGMAGQREMALAELADAMEGMDDGN